MESDALALEYQGNYGSARWNSDVAYLVDNTIPVGVCRVFGPGFSEEVFDLGLGNARAFLDNATDSLLVSE